MTNLLTMFPVVFLLFGGLVHGSTVNFKATPASLEPLVTKQLTLVCNLKDEPANDNENQQSDFISIYSMRISRNGANVARIDGNHPATKLGNNTGVVSGRFTDKGLNSHLQVSWAYPDDEQTGKYVCYVSGQNKQYQTVIVSKEIDIQKKNMNIQQMVGHMKALQKTVDKQVIQLQKQAKAIANLKATDDATKKTVTALAAKARVEPDVFFSTMLTRPGQTNIIPGQTVIYDRVFTNQGHGYSARTGEFRCPVTGFYTFQLHGYSIDGKYFYLGLKHNGKTAVTVTKATNNGYTGTSNTATLKLTQGDVVKVAGSGGYSTLYYERNNHRANTFSGRLISIIN